MQTITTKVKDWKFKENSYETPEGFRIGKPLRKPICACYQVPATLLNVDSKFGTDTFKEVLQVVSPEVQFHVDETTGEAIYPLDPRSKFLSDEDFDSLSNSFAEVLNPTSFTVKDESLTKTAVLTLPQVDTDQVFGDLYNRQVKLTRLPQGGVIFNAALLRLVCTNGALVADSQFSKLYRSSLVPKATVLSISSDVLALDLQEYMKSLFYKDSGTPVEASVADYSGMKETLKSYTDKDIADTFFPEHPINSFYSTYDIEPFNSPVTVQRTLRSGISYYDCFNILTNGIKQAVEMPLEAEIRVARWIKPTHLNELKRSTINYTGAPVFGEDLVKSLKGDVVAA